MNGKAIKYVEKVRYLGAYFCAYKCFKLSYCEPKASFYKSLNALYSKCKGCFDEVVMLKLIESYCKPLLLYASECVCAPSYDSYIKRAWDYTFWKIFHVNSNLVDSISEFTATKCFADTIAARRIKFRRQLSVCNNSVMHVLYDLCARVELLTL